MFSDILKEIQQ